MRKIDASSNTRWSVALRACAEGTSRPNGFSRTTRAPRAQSELASPWTTVGKRLGGMAR